MDFPFVSKMKESSLEQDGDDTVSLLAYSHNTIKFQDFKSRNMLLLLHTNWQI